ncbi:uncharacterized protein LOC132702504 [Cylas formicarius]|uniref:uncharacterized protein LOC132702504 n=1 Tax=Cylas formicarius TaxID=197179 RepID=UPI00295868F3|nr:uncharacterized protein LOC132702504 [Cylas formicarius]
MKLLAAALSVLLVFQAAQADTSLSDVVRAVLHNVVTGLGDFVQESKNLNEAALGNITGFSEVFLKIKLAIADQIFDGVTEQLGELLTKVEANTTTAGEAIINCVRDQKSAAQETLTNVVTDINACEETKFDDLNKGQKVIVDALDAFQVALKKVDDDFESCFLGDLCLLQLVQGLQGLSDEASGVGDAIKAFIAEVADYGNQIAACSSTEEPVLRQQAEDIFNAAADCIQTNINA